MVSRLFFWKDRWNSEYAFSSQYPILYELASNKDAIVAQIVGHDRFYLIFDRPLDSILHAQLINLYRDLSNVILNHEKDIAIWRWNSNGLFSTH
jgi:hypothetical protein